VASALAALPLFALLCGCGGAASQGSGSSGTFRLSGTISPQSIGSGHNEQKDKAKKKLLQCPGPSEMYA
jgi:hypothetical protein